MAYDEQLAARIRAYVAKLKGIEEKKMFGGLAFMYRGHMCCGVVKDTLMIRVGPERYQDVVSRPHARPMDFTGKPLKSMVYVDPSGFKTDVQLGKWIELGIDFVAGLPAK